MADFFEKLQKLVESPVLNTAYSKVDNLCSLLLWRQPDATLKLYKFLWAFFFISLFVSNSYMFTAIGKRKLIS